MAIVLEAAAPAELPDAGGRRKAFTLRTERIATSRAETTVLEDRALQVLPKGASRQETSTKRPIHSSAQFQLAQCKMQTIFATGEQVELLVRDDESIGKKGPGWARHLRLRTRGATVAARTHQSKGSSTGQTLSSNCCCAPAVGCMRSACIIPSTPPTPSSKNGTYGKSFSSASESKACANAVV